MSESTYTSPTMQQIEGNWTQFKGKLREIWGDLTDDELEESRGQVDRIVGAIEERTGENRKKIHDRIDELAREMKKKV